MSTAVAEPVKTAAEASRSLPALEDAFKTALTSQENEPAPVVVKEPEAKTEVAEPAKAEPVKAEPAKAAEPVKTEKKRSALDAALADDVPVAEPVEDEVQTLVASKDPNWDKARETMRRQSEELKTLREKTSKAAEPPAEVLAELKTLREEREKLKKENDEYRDSVMALDVKASPEYRTKLAARDAEVGRMASYVKEAGGDPQAFVDAMELTLGRRARVTDELLEGIESATARSTIAAKLAKIGLVDEELETQVAQPHKTYDELIQQRQQQAQQQQRAAQEAIQSTFEQVRGQLPKLSKFMRPAPEDAEGALEFNEGLKKDLDNAQTFLAPKSREDAAIWSFKVARYDSLEKIATERFAKDSARISELEDALAKFEGAEPGFRGGGKPKPKADYERPIDQVFAEALGKSSI